MTLDSSLASILTGCGVAGAFCILFVLGMIYPRGVVEDLRKERDAERARADAERARADANANRADAAIVAAQGTHDVLAALQAGVAMGIGQNRQQSISGSPSPPVVPGGQS